MINSKVLQPNHAKWTETAGAGGGEQENGSGTSEQRRRELADFLRTRREKLKPEQVGIMQGSRRRTPGLRREEVAELAGVGTTWYTWLEQARDIQPSSEVLRRLGHALQMTPAEIRHMFSLAGKAPPVDAETTEIPSESLTRFMDTALTVPAILLGARWDVLAMNPQAKQAFPALMELAEEKRNWVRFIFCTPGAKTGIASWEDNARRLIGEFRASVGESLDSPWVQELIDALRQESPEFAQWWREHDVRDNQPVQVTVSDTAGINKSYERLLIRPSENTRMKILILNPLP